jgi:putative chitinase
MANIVGEGFPSEIVSQIKQRQKVYGSINRTNQELTYLNARTGWCKLVSSVDVNTPPRGIQYTGTNLARKFILFNGTSNQVDKADLRQRYGIWPGTNEIGNDFYAYGMGGTNFGLNAMPGIISAEVRTETRGSLKTAEIKIKANNRNQFDIIDVLYMRLGFTLLLEWGNSSYFKNDGTYVADYTSLADNFLDGTLNYNNAFETIESKRKASCGNYDAIVGKVVNFQWSFLKDGTYDITVIVRSMGDVIESLKTNTLLPGAALDTAPSGSTEGETQTVEEGETPPEPTAEDVIKDFANTHEIGKFFYTMQQRMASLAPTTSGMSYLVSKGDGTIGFLKQKYEDEGGTQYYIRLGRFLSFIQTRLIPYVDNPDVKLLKIDINPETNLIYMLARQISTDPGVVIFNKVIPTPAGNVIFAEKGEVFEKEVNGNKYGKIMNAYFNMVYILTQMESLKDENGKVPLYDLLNCLCQGWNNATGNFNSLEPTVDSERNTIVFTDEVACPDRDDILKEQNKSTELAFFDVYGYYYTNEGASRAGFIRDISFTTTVSPNLASMITIGAQANGYVPGEDATAISAMNSGLTDRFKKKLDLEATKNNTTKGKNSLEESYQEQLAAYDTFIEELGSLNGETTPKWNPEAIAAFTNAASSLFEYDQAKQTEEKRDTNPNAASPNRGFLPFDLSLTMDGLSGMKVYQKYIIDTTYLPSNYPTSLEFLVKGVTNKIENNEWITVLESIAIPKSAQGSQVGQSAVSQASTPAGDSRDVVRGTAPIVKGSKTWDSLSQGQKDSANYLYRTLLQYGFTDIEARAILGIVSKESAFVPRNEISYAGTKASRIRQVFPSKFKNKTDAEIDVIKKDPQKFFDTIYGGRYGNASNEGYKYRGRGFNQLTFKGNYETYNNLYKANGSKAGPLDIIANPDLVNKQEEGVYKVASHIASLFFKRNKSNFFPKAPTNDLDTAVFNFMRANAGWGTSTSGAIFQEGLRKARAFVYSLPEKLG